MQYACDSIEAGGVWGPAAQKFFNDCASKADNLDRDIDFGLCSLLKFSLTTLCRVGVAVSSCEVYDPAYALFVKHDHENHAQ